MHIAVLGTGSMGSAIVEGLLDAGHAVTVYNRTESKTAPLVKMGATLATNPHKAILSGEGTILAVFDAAAIRELLAVKETQSAIKGRPLLNVAATSPDEIEALAKEVEGLGGRLSEVGIGAYPTHVRARKAQFLLAANKTDYALWHKVLSALGTVSNLGAVGNSSKAEMAGWLTYMFQTIAIAYAVGAFERLGLPTSVAQELLVTSPVIGVPGADALIPDMIARSYGDKMWSVDNFVASAEHITAFARGLGMPVAPLEAIIGVYKETAKKGFGKRDVTAIYEMFGTARSQPGGANK